MKAIVKESSLYLIGARVRRFNRRRINQSQFVGEMKVITDGFRNAFMRKQVRKTSDIRIEYLLKTIVADFAASDFLRVHFYVLMIN